MWAIPFLTLIQDPPKEAWWSGDWAYRRRIEMRNFRQAPLAKGTRVSVTLYKETQKDIRAKSKEDLSDFRLLHAGKEIAYEVGKSGEDVMLTFALPEELGGKPGREPYAADGRYFLYYGNKGAAVPAYAASDQFLFHLEPGKDKLDTKRIDLDDTIKCELSDKGWLIAGVDAAAVEGAPAVARLRLNSKIGTNFRWLVEVDSSGVDANSSGYIGVEGGMGDPAPGDDDRKKIDDLIRLLGHDDFEKREEATKALVQMGRTVLSQTRVAARSDDMEVQARARHIIGEIEAKQPTKLFSLGVRWQGGQGTAVGTLATLAPGTQIFPQPIGKPEKFALEVYRNAQQFNLNCRLDRSSAPVLDSHLNEASPDELRLVFWGDGSGRYPTLRIQRICVAPEANNATKPQSLLDVEEKRP